MHARNPSATALLVAASLEVLRAGDRTRALVAPPPCPRTDRLRAALAAASPQASTLLHLSRTRPGRAALRSLERALLPGIAEHYAVRKREILLQGTLSLRRDCRRAVILGAGLDLLSLHLLSLDPDLPVTEIDHPATQRLKRQILRDLDPPRAPRLEPLDLSAADAGALPARVGAREEGAENQSHPTLFVAEGLAMYLEPALVARLFSSLADAAAPVSRFVFTFMEPDPRTRRPRFRSQSRLVDLWLRLRAEPMRWCIPRADLPAFLHPLGWRLTTTYDAAQMRTRWVPRDAYARSRPPQGECLAIAVRTPRDRPESQPARVH